VGDAPRILGAGCRRPGRAPSTTAAAPFSRLSHEHLAGVNDERLAGRRLEDRFDEGSFASSAMTEKYNVADVLNVCHFSISPELKDISIKATKNKDIFFLIIIVFRLLC